jgi:hypothetical protein
MQTLPFGPSCNSAVELVYLLLIYVNKASETAPSHALGASNPRTPAIAALASRLDRWPVSHSSLRAAGASLRRGALLGV